MSATPLDAIIALLATSLGEDGARELVAREAATAGLEDPRSRDEVLSLLRRIEKLGGTAGLAARLAITRLERGVPLVREDTSSVIDAPVPKKRTLTVADVVAMLAPTFGDEHATATVHKALAVMQHRGTKLTKEEAAKLLETIVAQGGAVGTVARFAKVRLLLRTDKG